MSKVSKVSWYAVILVAFVLSFSGCGASQPVKDEATLKREAAEIDKKVKEGESGL